MLVEEGRLLASNYLGCYCMQKLSEGNDGDDFQWAAKCHNKANEHKINNAH